MTSDVSSADLARSLSSTLLLLVIVVAVSYPVTTWRLRRFHEATWRSLGEPRAFGWPFAASSWRLLAFAASFRHLRLDDLTLSLACVAFTLGLLAAVAGMVAALLWMLTGG